MPLSARATAAFSPTTWLNILNDNLSRVTQYILVHMQHLPKDIHPLIVFHLRHHPFVFLGIWIQVEALHSCAPVGCLESSLHCGLDYFMPCVRAYVHVCISICDTQKEFCYVTELLHSAHRFTGLFTFVSALFIFSIFCWKRCLILPMCQIQNIQNNWLKNVLTCWWLCCP